VRTTQQQDGDAAEDLVAGRLAAAGWTILGRQVHAGRAELDLIAVDPGPPAALVVVEVRWRRSRTFGLAEESLDFRKRAHLRAAIGRLLEDGLPGPTTLPSLPVRVDLVVIEPAGIAGGPPRLRHHEAISI
jgi:Holliday junction resolvase-like predicted endonuclease